MHYIKKIYVLLLTGSIVSITGCSAIQYGTEDLPKPTYQKSTEDTAKDIVKSKAEEEHQEFELSDEFVSKYNWNFFSRILLIGGDNNMTNNKLSKLETENYKKEDYHEKKEVPIYCKLNLTLKEAALYSNIGINKLNSLTSDPDCPFVLFIGHKKLIKRKPFEDFINNEFTQSL